MSKISSVFIVTHPEVVLHPAFYDQVLRTRPAHWEVTGAAIVPTRHGVARELQEIRRIAGPVATARLLAWSGLRVAGNVIHGHPTVESVMRHHGVPVTDVRTPNDPAFVDALAADPPDIAFFAVDHYLKAPVLDTPKVACVNRHAGKLPDYRGVKPVYHVLRAGEPRAWVTFHTMVEEIDGGQVLWEGATAIGRRDTVSSIYRRLFLEAARGFWAALDRAVAGDGVRTIDLDDGEYFSRATAAQVDEFQRRRCRYA